MTSLIICPIGTCRIHQPLRISTQRYPIALAHGRNYGYVHTSTEALQQLRFINGEKNFSDEVQKLFFRPGTSASFMSSPHTPADLYLVEISSNRLHTVDGQPIQCNYTYRYFSDFFSNNERANLFWSMARDDQIASRRTMLENIPAFQRLSLDDRELLARIQRRDLSDDEIERDMEEIVQLVGRDKLVFVTHVNACTPDNAVIGRRNALIRMVRETAKRMDVVCYDPTPLMRRLEQVNAIANDGLDLAHYTDLFNERLCEDWYKVFILPRLDTSSLNDVTPQEEGQFTDIEALWNAGQHLDASRQVHEALRSQPDLRRHRMLLGRMQYELGDYENAIRNLQSAQELGGTNDEKNDLMLMRAYFRMEQYREARSCAQALLSDETVTLEIMRVCAVSATHLNEQAVALGEWKQLFRLGEDKAEAAQAVLNLLEATADTDAVLNWVGEVLDVLPTHGPCFAVLWNQRIAQANRAGLLEMASRTVELSEWGAFELVQRAALQNFSVPAALLAAAHALPDSRDPEIAAWVKQQAAHWLQQGIDQLDAGELLEAADNIQARAHLSPINNTLRRVRRTLEQKMRVEIRRAFQEKRYEEVMKISLIANQTLTRFPELDSFTGRAAYAQGDNETALLYLKRAASEEDATVVAKILLARTAARSGDHIEEAIDAYKELLQSEPAEEWVQTEAQRQIPRLESRLARVAREMLTQNEYDRAWALLERAENVDADNPAVAREKKRVISTLYSRLKSLDPDNVSERLVLGETILRFSPDDAVGLKAAATGAMRTHRFTEALHYWSLLRTYSEKPELIDANIKKCHLWIDRARRKKQSGVFIPRVSIMPAIDGPSVSVDRG
jgi:tetratricopeptide (TPR) repeat protein